MTKIRKLMHGVMAEWNRMKAWYRAYNIKKLPNSPVEVKCKEAKVMEDTAPTFNHTNPLYAETAEDVRAAQILKEASLWKGKVVCFHPNKKKEQKTVKKAVEAEKNLKAVPARTK